MKLKKAAELKGGLAQNGRQLVTNCHQLKMQAAADGKQRLTDVATAEILLRLVQSITSPKAEPIKLWLAKVGYERMQEMTDPALSLNRARETWQQHGCSEKWIQQRMTGQANKKNTSDRQLFAVWRQPNACKVLIFRWHGLCCYGSRTPISPNGLPES